MTVELADLERALAELADSLEFPAASDMPERVIAELDRPASVTPLVQRPAVRRVLALAAAAIVLAGVVLVASPRARKAVADLLGIGGVAIRTSDTTPAIPPTTLSSAPSSSRSTSPSTASSASPSTVGPPGSIDVEDGASAIGVAPPLPPSLGPPQTVTLADGRLTLEWPPSTILPATDLPELGAVLAVFRGRVEEPLLEKVLGPGTAYERVSVGGRPGVWLSGAPHVLMYLGPGGQVREDQLRLAGNTLLWTVGPHTYRLESALDRDAAIALAETVPTS
jgi:hypothetical protein